ncbi:MAG TPA: hypothetical protein VFH23_13095 [Jiangellaceae bacterium]|jgi:hypothetical protein|nr:hypothetical protein [Jiangellaceae bacterium]
MGGSDRQRREAVLAQAELRTRRRARGRAARRAATMRAVSALQLAAGARLSMSR